MTISYQRDVASSTAGGFTRLLFKWKASSDEKVETKGINDEITLQ